MAGPPKVPASCKTIRNPALAIPELLEEWIVVLESQEGPSSVRHRPQLIHPFDSSPERIRAFEAFHRQITGKPLSAIASLKIPEILAHCIELQMEEDHVSISKKTSSNALKTKNCARICTLPSNGFSTTTTMNPGQHPKPMYCTTNSMPDTTNSRPGSKSDCFFHLDWCPVKLGKGLSHFPVSCPLRYAWPNKSCT